MRWERLSAWNANGIQAGVLCLVLRAGAQVPAPIHNTGTRVDHGEITAHWMQQAMRSPIGDVRRVALMPSASSADPLVQKTLSDIRALGARKRRQSLFTLPAPSDGTRRVVPSRDVSPHRNPGKAATVTRSQGSAVSVPPYAPQQMEDIAAGLFRDALSARLSGRLNLEITPEAETVSAARDLNLKSAELLSGVSVASLCKRLKCDAIIVPRVIRLRSRVVGTRVLSIWTTVRILRPGSRSTTAGAAPPSVLELPAAGASATERAPFQERFMKDWPQLLTDAARQAAAITVRTLVAGEVAPFVRVSERVGVAPVSAPAQADALVFHAAGRTVVPAALTGLPVDVSTYFHPDLLPLFPDDVVSSVGAATALAGEPPGAGGLWTKSEAPDSVRAAALGRRLKVQYIVMACVCDLEMALNDPQQGRDRLASHTAIGAQDGQSADSPALESATAEAIGALVRVSDGAILWRDRTSATMHGGAGGSGAAAFRKHIALEAIRFSLVQLERRFRQFRLRYE